MHMCLINMFFDPVYNVNVIKKITNCKRYSIIIVILDYRVCDDSESHIRLNAFLTRYND